MRHELSNNSFYSHGHWPQGIRFQLISLLIQLIRDVIHISRNSGFLTCERDCYFLKIMLGSIIDLRYAHTTLRTIKLFSRDCILNVVEIAQCNLCIVLNYAKRWCGCSHAVQFCINIYIVQLLTLLKVETSNFIESTTTKKKKLQAFYTVSYLQAIWLNLKLK